MSIKHQIEEYITSQPEVKRIELEMLHQMILQMKPNVRLWFLDGKNEAGKIISNPNIGYGTYIIKYANGSTKEFYKIGMSANTTGISIYIMGIEDKKLLAEKFANKIGKASISRYCIKFKTTNDIDIDVLKEAIKLGFNS